jgi:HemY protein
MVTFLDLGKMGRLGNQMFQIASTIGVALQNGKDFSFPDWVCRHSSNSYVDLFIKKLPKTLTYDVQIAEEYARFLLQNHQNAAAEKIVRNSVRQQWSNALILLYCDIPYQPSQLTFAESLLSQQPHCAALFFCLGRLCQQQQLWGKAQAYFEQSIEYGPTPEAYLELGQLFERLNDIEKACRAYRAGILLKTTPPLCPS